MIERRVGRFMLAYDTSLKNKFSSESYSKVENYVGLKKDSHKYFTPIELYYIPSKAKLNKDGLYD